MNVVVMVLPAHAARLDRPGAPPAMPLPPLRSLITAARTAADYALDPLLDLTVAAYVPPKPQPQPLDYVGIIHDTGTSIIEQITEPSSLPVLSELRVKLIADSDGHRSMTIVQKEVGAQIRPGQLTRSILDVMEANMVGAYRLLLG
jgi:hypothetical protein